MLLDKENHGAVDWLVKEPSQKIVFVNYKLVLID